MSNTPELPASPRLVVTDQVGLDFELALNVPSTARPSATLLTVLCHNINSNLRRYRRQTRIYSAIVWLCNCVVIISTGLITANLWPEAPIVSRVLAAVALLFKVIQCTVGLDTLAALTASAVTGLEAISRKAETLHCSLVETPTSTETTPAALTQQITELWTAFDSVHTMTATPRSALVTALTPASSSTPTSALPTTARTSIT